MLSCTFLQTVCKPVMDRELSLPQQNSSPCSLVKQGFLCLVLPPALWPRLTGRDKIGQHKFKFFNAERNESPL